MQIEWSEPSWSQAEAVREVWWLWTVRGTSSSSPLQACAVWLIEQCEPVLAAAWRFPPSPPAPPLVFFRTPWASWKLPHHWPAARTLATWRCSKASTSTVARLFVGQEWLFMSDCVGPGFECCCFLPFVLFFIFCSQCSSQLLVQPGMVQTAQTLWALASSSRGGPQYQSLAVSGPWTVVPPHFTSPPASSLSVPSSLIPSPIPSPQRRRVRLPHGGSQVSWTRRSEWGTDGALIDEGCNTSSILDFPLKGKSWRCWMHNFILWQTQYAFQDLFGAEAEL